MPLDALPDHVAIAVPDPDRTAHRWEDRFGGGLLTMWDNGTFKGRQYRYPNGTKLEVIGPSPEDDEDTNFLRRFLDRFGTRIHHVTLKVTDIHAAVDAVQDAGLDVVDVSTEGRHWREAFLRPSQVGGLVVQLAWASHTDEEWARRNGHEPAEPAADAASFLGARMRHPDLARADQVWSALGARVEDRDGRLVVTWEGSPLGLIVEEGEPPGPTALRFTDADPQDADPTLGPPVEVD